MARLPRWPLRGQQEHHAGTSNDQTTVSRDSDFGYIMEVYENFFTISKYLIEIRKYLSELILQKNIIKSGDPSHIGTFP